MLMKEVQERFPEAVFIEVFGHYLPMVLTPTAELTEPLKLVFPFAKGFLRVSGADHVTLLQGLCTQDLKKWQLGQTGRNLFPDNHGKVVFDCFTLKEEGQILLVADPGEEENLKRMIEFYTITEDVTVEKVQGYEIFFLLGQEPMEEEGLKSLFQLDTNQGQLRVVLAEEGENGFSSLMEQGYQPIGFEQFEEIRPAFGFARAGVDFNRDHLPQEAGLEHAVNFNKGCYVGQEPISRVAFRGRLKRKLGLIKGDQPILNGSPLMLGEDQLGVVTSGSSLCIGGQYYALAYLDTHWMLEGSESLVSGEGSYELAQRVERHD